MNKRLLLYISLLATVLTVFPLMASAQKAILKGRVTTIEGAAVPYVSIYLKDTNHAVATNRDGDFTLTAPAGKYILVATYLGYDSFESAIELIPGYNLRRDIVMDESSTRIEDVVVHSKSLVQQVRESSYNVVAIDASVLHNTTLDLAHTLNRTSGIKIRETGGVGSDAQINLNGFTGRHVKIFMDGLPMEGGGSSFQINNIPVGIAQRIEVYKGVVPIELGSDAIGGAINIITRTTSNTYVDASYSYGSFNTHRTNLNIGHVTSNGFTVQLNAYQNYSDNSYKVKSQLMDLEGSTYSKEEYWFRRFHDMYRNETVIFKTGVTGKKWSDRMLFGIRLSQEEDEIQTANIMRIVFGGKVRKSKSASPSFNYEKKNLVFKNLDLSVSANYNLVRNNSTDTLARQYNWLGEYREKKSKGEGTYTLSETDNSTLNTTVNLRYRISNSHYFAVNNVFTGFSRKATDAAANAENSTVTTFMKRRNRKNVFGFSYRYAPNEKINLSAFGKYYDLTVTGPVDVSTGNTAVYEQQTKNHNVFGYGFLATYMVLHDVQLKASYEQAYRLPSERELFGDEVLETGETKLKPERSRNLNLNLSYNGQLNRDHSLYVEAGIFYRDTRDYIRRFTEESKGGGAFYENHGKVRNVGFDAEARYLYRDRFSVGSNLTWQNFRNRQKYSKPSGTDQTVKELIYYNDRMPNVPYFFSNVEATYNFHNVILNNSVLSLSYSLNYVHEFFRNWQSEGAIRTIPSQLSHDASLTYSFCEGTYNLAFEALNFTNEILYDNYSLQKPGRYLGVKARYFFFKSGPASKKRVEAQTGDKSGKYSQGGKHRRRYAKHR